MPKTETNLNLTKECDYIKKLIAFVLALVCVLSFVGCNSRSMNYIIENEPSIIGIVKDTNDNSILIENEDGEYWVSLDIENKDSMTHFSIGDEVAVYYDGNIAESYPMQINTVYAITLRTPAGRENGDENEQTEQEAVVGGDLIPMVMIDGVLYCDTGRESSITGRCGMMDGEITSSVSPDQAPTENDQSNFGTGYQYQFGLNDTVEIYIDKSWIVFEQMKDSA